MASLHSFSSLFTLDHKITTGRLALISCNKKFGNEKIFPINDVFELVFLSNNCSIFQMFGNTALSGLVILDLTSSFLRFEAVTSKNSEEKLYTLV